nr:histidine kinase [Pseudoclavibacter alba]
MTAWSFAWVVRVLLQLEQARESQARLAVADERLRISRDLHDTFGRTLATISVKSTLAGELVRRDRATDAAKELDEIRDIADRAGKEVRAIVRGEAEVGLGQEFIGARALLASAGIHTTVVGEPDTVPQELGAALAWIVREGVTNILRHSHATQASLSINVEGGLLTLLLANDGARRDTSGSQTGIAGMRERVNPFAGTVTATRDAEWFTLEVTAHATKGVSA